MKKLLFVSLVFAMTTSAFAAGYGAAGCGLGSMVFEGKGSNVWWKQTLAATTNATSYSQTFGITTGTSNCGDSFMGKTAKANFIEANRVALANDIARGTGMTLASLSGLYGCGNAEVVGATLQENYERIFPSENVAAAQIDSTISNILETTQACI